MTTETIEVKGVAVFVETLAAAAVSLKDMHDAAEASGRLVAGLASTTAPRRTGRLAGSVLPEVEGATVDIGSDLIYAPPIHNGWVAHSIAPHPFLVTALDRLQSQVVGEYQKSASAALGRVEGA